MNKKINERPVFPFTSIVGQEEMCDYKIYKNNQFSSNLIL